MFVAFLLSRIHAYQRYRASIRRLAHFSGRELDDLGISRYESDAAASFSYAAARAAMPSDRCLHPPTSILEITL